MTLAEFFDAIRGRIQPRGSAPIRHIKADIYFQGSFVNEVVNELELKITTARALGEKLSLTDQFTLHVLAKHAGVDKEVP